MTRASKTRAETTRRSDCPVANTLDVIGDKWSLLVIRDLLHGRQTYSEILASPEGIPTNILAERLRRLEAAGVVRSAPYQERPVRYAYELTEKGRDLGEVLRALVRWGKRHIPGTRTYSEIPGATKRASATGRTVRGSSGGA